jgi:hypothetical protein
LASTHQAVEDPSNNATNGNRDTRAVISVLGRAMNAAVADLPGL